MAAEISPLQLAQNELIEALSEKADYLYKKQLEDFRATQINDVDYAKKLNNIIQNKLTTTYTKDNLNDLLIIYNLLNNLLTIILNDKNYIKTIPIIQYYMNILNNVSKLIEIANLSTSTPSNSTGSTTQAPASQASASVSNKYLKYKTKYLNLKNSL